MFLSHSKYLLLKPLKLTACLVAVLLCHCSVLAQEKIAAANQSTLFYYHSFAKNNTAHTYSKLQYTRPDNQLMSWPNYPLTAVQIEQRNKQWEQDNKLSNKIAKDVITSILSKKKKPAVIPKF
jgi:phosphoglycerol transferase MdoB-like AlkP superfamily enzyme